MVSPARAAREVAVRLDIRMARSAPSLVAVVVAVALGDALEPLEPLGELEAPRSVCSSTARRE